MPLPEVRAEIVFGSSDVCTNGDAFVKGTAAKSNSLHVENGEKSSWISFSVRSATKI